MLGALLQGKKGQWSSLNEGGGGGVRFPPHSLPTGKKGGRGGAVRHRCWRKKVRSRRKTSPVQMITRGEWGGREKSLSASPAKQVYLHVAPRRGKKEGKGGGKDSDRAQKEKIFCNLKLTAI